MKKVLSFFVILFAFSCDSDILPDSIKVCALMEEQSEFLEDAIDSDDRFLMRSTLQDNKNINVQIVSIKSKYSEDKFDEQLSSICTNGEGDVLDLERILTQELLSLEVKAVCEIQGINYRRFMDVYDRESYGLSKDEISEAVLLYEDYTAQINEIRSKYDQDFFNDELSFYCNEEMYGEPIDYNELFLNLQGFYIDLKSKL